jgi:putative drug exporter of the RND superfamily
LTALAARTRISASALEHPEAIGPVGKLGRWAADHVRAVAIAWAVLAVALGIFAPRVESALSGAGWQANRRATARRNEYLRRRTHRGRHGRGQW